MKGGSERGNKYFRFLDTYVGIPAVAAAGVLTRRRPMLLPRDIRKAAFLRTAAIGDTVLMSAAIKDFIDLCPDASITVFAGASNYDVACLLPGVHQVVRLPITHPLKAFSTVRTSGTYDIWVDFGQWPRYDALLSWCSRARLKVGFRTPGQHRHAVYDVVVNHSTTMHESDNFRALVALGGPPGTNKTSLAVTSAQTRNAGVVMHMYPGGSRAAAKTWPEDNWADLIQQVIGWGHKVQLTGGQSDAEAAYHMLERLGGHESVRVVAGQLSIRETAELLLSSAAVVSVDTGVMHMASALGCNLVALHGPTLATRWGPLNDNSVAVQSHVRPDPVIQLGFEGRNAPSDSMREIQVDEVARALENLLAAQDRFGVFSRSKPG